MRLLLCWLLLTGTTFADCVTLDISAWTTDQRTLLPSVAYELYADAGEDIVPVVTGGQVCFAGSTLDVKQLITAPLVLARYTSDEAKRQAATVVEQQHLQALRTSIQQKLGLTDEEFAYLLKRR